VHTGSIIAGVVGEKKLRYDMWGPDCLIANTLEALGKHKKNAIEETDE
jgi:adenylate cyclase